MSDLEVNHSFVEPYYIEALGTYGLTMADIAKSLRIEASLIRRKIRERGFLDRIKTQGFQAMPFGMDNIINGLSFEEYLLDVSAAKFFVAKYDSDMGDSYLAFLLRIEQKYFAEKALIASDPLLQEIAAIHKLRVSQIEQAKKTLALEIKAKETEDDVEKINDAILDSILSVTQKKCLKELIDSTAKAFGDISFVGCIQRDLKARFGLNATNDKWYHLPQRQYQEALEFVGSYFTRK